MISEIAKKTILVTGGCGFIGSHLITNLFQLGAKAILVLDSFEYGLLKNIDSSKKPIQIFKHRLGADSFSFLEKTLEGVDCIFHLAAEKHNQSIDNPLKVIDANISGTQALLQAAVACGVKKVVFASSLYAYGRMKGGPFDEEETLQPKTVYGISKLAGEHLCAHFHEKHGLPYVALRYLFVYGPRQYANLGYKSVIVKNFQRLLAGNPPIIKGDGQQALDYVFVEDAVKATIMAMEASLKSEVLNVCTGTRTTVTNLLQMMQEVAGTRLPPIFEPPDETHGSCRVGDPGKLKAKLGYVPQTPLPSGLRATFEWIKENRPQ